MPIPSLPRLAAATRLAVLVLAAAATGAARAQAGIDCTIEPHQSAELRWPVDGVVEQVLVQRGDRVKAGQPLAQLESTAERSGLQAARQRAVMTARIELLQHRRDQAERKAARTLQLQQQALASTQAAEEAETERRVADAEWRDAIEARDLARLDAQHAEDLLGRRTLRAPFDGVIVDRLVNPGDLADAGARKAALRIAQVDPLRVEAVLPLSLAGRIRPGAAATVVPEGQGTRLPARVVLVDPIVDAASGTFGVRLSLASTVAVAGLRCRLEFAGLAMPAPVAASAAAAPRAIAGKDRP